jgi:hypothetical protein
VMTPLADHERELLAAALRAWRDRKVRLLRYRLEDADTEPFEVEDRVRAHDEELEQRHLVVLSDFGDGSTAAARTP